MLLTALSWCLAGPLTIDIETVDADVSKGTRLHLQYTLWQVQTFYERRLSIDYPKSIDLDVVVYGDETAYRKVAEAAGRPAWSAGWFGTSRDGRHTARFHTGGSEARLSEVFLHEGSHFLVAFGGRIPRWLNEGLAEALGASHTQGRELIVKTPGYRRRALMAKGVGSVKDLVLDPKKWKDLPKDSASERYTRAWAVTTVLLSTDNGGDTLEAIAVAYRRTGDQQSALRAIQNTYRGGLEALQRDADAFAANPPATITISRTLKGPLNSDAVWTNCPDGRLVRTETGCGY